MNETPTMTDSILSRIKNNKWAAWPIVLATVFLALVTFAKGMQEAGSIFGKAFGEAQSVTAYDDRTKEELISVARKIDLFFLSQEYSTDDDLSLQNAAYLEIQVDLNSLHLRNQIRPNNAISIEQSQLFIDNWAELGKLLESNDGQISPAINRAVRGLLAKSARAMATLEEAKRSRDSK